MLFQFFILSGSFASDYPVTTYLGIDQGLSNNSIRSIYQDQKGFMWLGTYDGLNRYDGYEFKVFKNNFKNSASLINNWINAITEDKEGNIWVGTRQGVCIYHNLSDNFSPVYYQVSKNKINKITSEIRDIERDDQGNMFIGTMDMGLLFCPKGDSVAYRIALDNDLSNQAYDAPAIKIGMDKKVWFFARKKGLYIYDYQLKKARLVNATIGSANCLEASGNWVWLGNTTGVHRYNILSNSFDKTYNVENKKLNCKDVVAITLGKNNEIWIATNGGGITVLNFVTDQTQYLVESNERYSLSGNSVCAIWVDQQSRKWIGTLRGGINIIDPNKERFHTVAANPKNSNSLISNYVFSFYEAPEGNLWVGTDGGGLSVWDRKRNRFTNYKHDPNNQGSLSENFITAIQGDDQNNIWVATYRRGLNRFNRASNSFEHCKFINPYKPNTGINPLTLTLFEDAQKKIWVGALVGLFRLNRESMVFELFDDKLKDLFVLREDKTNIFWAGDLSHLIQIDRENKKHVFYPIGQPVRSIWEDKAGNFWIGTEGGGLILFDRKQKKIGARYTADEGLCSNSILNILEDDKGNLWMSSFNGISMLNVKTRKFTNYYQSDGLQSNQFNYNAALKLKSGELAFGGIKGFTIFRPETISNTNSTPGVFFTGIKISNTPIEQESSWVSKATPNSVESIKVPFDKAVVTFEFAALEYSAPDKIQYAYYLDGWDRGWNYSGKIRNATYTHLSEGSYILRIKSTNAAGVWSDKELRLSIMVLPPWYRSWWAYMLYAIAVGSLIYYYWQYRSKQTRLQYEVKIATLNAENERAERERNLAELQKEKIEREKSEAELALERAELGKERAEREKEYAEREKERIIIEKERELSEKQISFFTNISHEFRTPLTLIINPVKDLLNKKSNDQLRQESELNIVYRNARRMLSLVDQLLLFRKAESSLDKINPGKLNICNLAREVYLCFIHQAKVKNIDYVFEYDSDKIEIYADREKLEIILYNLLSNAIKYTPDSGSIQFAISDKEENVVIKVKDTGAGIPTVTGDRLFEKFYQADRDLNSVKPGFGIGLFLVKHFTEQHNGTVSYKSEEGKGATFTLKLLKGKEHFAEGVIVKEGESGSVFLQELKEETDLVKVEAVEKADPIADVVTEKKGLLIVEDDEQIRQYLTQLFKNNYTIYQSENGEKALELAQNYLPDLIISDIHMQGLSGIDLCRRIKENEDLNHIPVILLTASSSDELKLQGVEGGADDYIRKPFDNQLLVARVNNLLKSRNNLQKYFYNEITLHKSNQKISPEYKEFLEKCISIVESHLEDEDFTLKILLSEMGMSHSNLFRKVKSISGLSVNVFIRFIRLRKAAELFVTSDYNVNETAFMVGIKDTKYFREQFNKLFKMNPSEYIKKYRNVYGKQFTVNKNSIECYLDKLV